MKKIFLFIALGLFSFSALQAQPAQREERIKALYVAYITESIQLTETEAQKFWPAYTEYDNDVKAVNMDLPELEKQQAILNIKKKYQDRFSKIIGSDRTNTFFVKDAEFRKRMIERLRKARQGKSIGF